MLYSIARLEPLFVQLIYCNPNGLNYAFGHDWPFICCE